MLSIPPQRPLPDGNDGSSLGKIATIDSQLGAGHEACFVARQKQNGIIPLTHV